MIGSFRLNESFYIKGIYFKVHFNTMFADKGIRRTKFSKLTFFYQKRAYTCFKENINYVNITINIKTIKDPVYYKHIL